VSACTLIEVHKQKNQNKMKLTQCIALTTVLLSSAARSDLTPSNLKSQISDGERDAGSYTYEWRFLNLRHVPQETDYHCGAANTSSLLHWELLKETGTHQLYTTKSLYSYMNTVGAKDSGLTADELKDGIRKIFGYISRMKTGVNLQLGLKEVKEYSIRNAYDSVLETLRDTASPVIVYGNVDYVDGEGPDGADYGAAGGHYFMINSVMKLVADKGVTFRHNQKGYAHLVRVMNPIAHSDYYRNHDDMIRPSSNLWHYDDSITKQWRKSGSPWPFGDRHMYLANEVK